VALSRETEHASELGVVKIQTVGSWLDLSKENAMQIKTDKALSWEEQIEKSKI